MNKKVVIIGAGGHAKVIADIIEASGDELVGFLDDDAEKVNKEIIENKKVLGNLEKIEAYQDCEFIIGIGNNKVRDNIAAKYSNIKWYTAVHPSAIVSHQAKIGRGTVIMPGVVINSGTKIGEHCIINTHVTVEHDNDIGDFVHLSPNVTLCGTVSVGQNSWICAGATVINNIQVAPYTTVGAGAVVIKDIIEGGDTYIGVPARRKNE